MNYSHTYVKILFLYIISLKLNISGTWGSIQVARAFTWRFISFKSIPNLPSNRFGPNWFGINLGIFACVHMTAKSIGIGSKSILKSYVYRVIYPYQHAYVVNSRKNNESHEIRYEHNSGNVYNFTIIFYNN